MYVLGQVPHNHITDRSKLHKTRILIKGKKEKKHIWFADQKHVKPIRQSFYVLEVAKKKKGK